MTFECNVTVSKDRMGLRVPYSINCHHGFHLERLRKIT